MAKFIVQTASAQMPSSCKGEYRRVAVLKVRDEYAGGVSMISHRAKGVIQIVSLWDRLNVGKTERCAYRQALAAAKAEARELQIEEDCRVLAESAVLDALVARYDVACAGAA